MVLADTSRLVRHSVGSLRAALPGYVGLVYALVLVWGLGDVLSTFAAASAVGSVAAEANPWIRLLFGMDPLFVLALKAAVVLYAGIVLLECRPVVERVPGWRAWFVVVVGIGWLVVVNNLAVAFVAMV